MKEELEILVRNVEEKLNIIYYDCEFGKPPQSDIRVFLAKQGFLLEELLANLKLLITKQEQQ